MTFWQAIWFSVLQGMTELAPVSSLGHGVLLPLFTGWTSVSHNPDFLPFMVSLHLGTALALLVFFRADWIRLFAGGLAVLGYVPRGGDRESLLYEGRVLGFLIGGTIPAAILGFVLEKKIRVLFGSPAVASIFLGVNGLMLFLGERLRRQSASRGRIGDLSMPKAVLIGGFQALALIPGLSRSGITMVGGIINGLSHEDAARFSFLLSTPIIFGAGVLEIPKLIHGGHSGMIRLSAIGGCVSFAAAYLTTFFLMRYFRSYEAFRALYPFGIYCLALSLISGFLIFFPL